MICNDYKPIIYLTQFDKMMKFRKTDLMLRVNISNPYFEEKNIPKMKQYETDEPLEIIDRDGNLIDSDL